MEHDRGGCHDRRRPGSILEQRDLAETVSRTEAPKDAAIAHDVRRPGGKEPIGVANLALDDHRRPSGRPLDLHALRQLFEDDEREGREQRIAAEEVQLTSRQNTWGKQAVDPFWVYGYDAWQTPLARPSTQAAG